MEKAMKVKIVSSLEKIYCGDKMPQEELKGISLLKDEKKSFQIAIESSEEEKVTFSVKSTLKNLKTYLVKHIKSDLPMTKKGADDYYRFSKNGYYPDLLVPCENEIELKKGITVIWVEVDARENEVGSHKISVNIDKATAEAEVRIIDACLDFDDFVYTCWFHTDCLMSYYKFDAFSPEYWQVTESFLKTAAEHGMNCVLTPVFTPALDTEKGKERPTVQLVDVKVENGKYSFNFDKLSRWIEMAERCNIRYFEISHFYTQWGAGHAPKIMAEKDGEYTRIFGWDTKASSKEYKDFLLAFSDEFKNYLEKNGLKQRVFFHVSDEPNASTLISYTKASKYIHKLFKGYKIIDALSDYLFYKLKIVSNPIPSNSHISPFIGKADNLWTYYCSAQKNHYVSNRFFCNESLRTRVLGYQLFKFDIKGFLHWGYNFYYTRLSKKLIDPFTVSDAGGEFPSGDSYIVYPAPDGTAYHSIRLKVFYDALQDMAALNTLKKLTDKNTCLDIIEQKGKHKLTFRHYPHENSWLLDTREEVNRKIEEILLKNKS